MSSQAVGAFLAASSTDIDPDTGHGPEWGAAAPIGLLVIVLMCVAGYFLAKSFSRHIKRVPASFGPLPAADDDGAVSASGVDEIDAAEVVGPPLAAGPSVSAPDLTTPAGDTAGSSALDVGSSGPASRSS